MVKNTSPILSALRAATLNEQAAVEFMEQYRWNGTPACPRCGSVNVYKMTGRDGARNKDFRLRCRDCAGPAMFTVRTGTTFEESRLPMKVWVYAFWKACSSKKGISALQLSRETEITHKSALFVLRRIRHGVGYDPKVEKKKMLTGTVEIDETYVGGKPRYAGSGRMGRRTTKTPVIGMVERGGDVRFRVIERLTAATLGPAIAEHTSIMSRVITDELYVYGPIAKEYKGGHETVTHSRKEYVRFGTDIHSNTVEGVFSLLKRGVMGTFHSISKKHLPNYLNEFEFRHNTRKMDDGQRVSAAIRKVEGKRLQYRESVDNPPYQPKAYGQLPAEF